MGNKKSKKMVYPISEPASPQDSLGVSTKVISWEEYFMGIAILSSMRSKDPCTKVGACIVNPDKRIVGIGYNGMPRNCADQDFPWSKEPDAPPEKTKYAYVVHAELNAILNSSGSLEKCTLYVTHFPCQECVKAIVQKGITRIVYYYEKDNKSGDASQRMLKANQTQFVMYPNTLDLVFNICPREKQ